MKEDEVDQFFKKHRETVNGDVFNTRLFNTLNYLPQPKPATRKHPLIVACTALVGFLLFVLLGGYGVVMHGIAAIGQVFVDVRAFTPEVISACILLGLTLLALVRFAVRSYQR